MIHTIHNLFSLLWLESKLDKRRLGIIRDRYREASPDPGYSKYLNVRKFLWINLKYKDLLGRFKLGARVLDIGSGCGFLPFILKHSGFEVLCSDTQSTPFYEEMIALLQLNRVLLQVVPRKKLILQVPSKFDLVTASMITFDRHPDGKLWEIKDWHYFLSDLSKNVLLPGGGIFLSLNAISKDEIYPENILNYFKSMGGSINEHTIYFPSTQLILNE